MFGVFFGTVCLVLLIVNLRRHRYAGYGWGWGHGDGSYYGYRHGPRWSGWGRSPKRRAFQHLLERLDTTPGQEKVLRRTVETVRESLDDVGDDLKAARRALAQAIAGEELDQAALTSAIEKQEAIVNRVRVGLVEAVKTVHETLDGRQRRALAEWIAEGCSWRDLSVREL
jgi:Spy/CpxP family protein refolding chaperone